MARVALYAATPDQVLLLQHILAAEYGVETVPEPQKDGRVFFEVGEAPVDPARLATGFDLRTTIISGRIVERDLPPFTEADYMPGVESLFQRKAAQYGYDNIISACSYFSSTVTKFRREGQAFVLWRDMVWQNCIGALASGVYMTPDEFLDQLPVYEDVLASIE